MSSSEDLTAKAIQNRDQNAFEHFFRAHYATLVAFANGYLCDHAQAEDTVQTVFSELWENAGRLEIRSSLKAYTYEATKNKCLNLLRQIQIRDRHNILYVQGLMEASSIEDSAIDPELNRRLRAALQKLPPKMRRIMELKYTQAAKVKEISVELQISENTVKTQLKRAREKVRNAMLAILVLLIAG
ncbi:MAG: RNA polymerase sigma-70 factor [Bacteroidota bacterium]